MVKIVGKDKKIAKQITCKNCAAILEYLPKDVKTRSYSCMGETDVLSYIKCPDCKEEVVTRY